MCRAILMLPLALSLAGSTFTPVLAGSDPDTSFVQANCGTCHATGRLDHASPYEGAVPFADLAGNPAVSALALRVMLQTSHRAMPNLSLTPDQTAAVVAYILGLRGGAPTVPRGLTEINDRGGDGGQDRKIP